MKLRMVKYAVLGAAALVTCTGCYFKPSRPPTYRVTGTVTMKGKPLADARVVFVPVDGATGRESAAGIADANGKYSLTTYVAGDGAQPGEYGVKVGLYEIKKPTKEEQQAHMRTLEEEQKMAFPDSDKPIPPAKNLLPKKYESEQTSGISHTVSKRPTVKDINLD